MKRNDLTFILTLLITTKISAEQVSCNERFRHGRIGAVKGIAATACIYSSHHILKSFWNRYLGTGFFDINSLEMRRNTSMVETACATITLGALTYVTYKLGSEAVESLNVFFDDGEEADGTLLKVP